jgi:hypothetical protein
VLIVQHLGHGQFIYIGLPGDAINGSPDFLCPTTNQAVVCTMSAPGIVMPGQSIPVKVHGHASGYSGSPPAQLQLGTVSPANSALVGPQAGDTNDYETVFTMPARPPGLYTVDGFVRDPGTGVEDTDCSATFRVAAQPYLSIYGSDAIAGMTATTNGSQETCVASPQSDPAGFITWNNGSTAGWSGAGAQFAVQALGLIDDFASGRGSNPDISPNGLAFSNDATLYQPSTTPRVFGGNFDAITGVGCDYTSGVTFTSTITAANYTNAGLSLASPASNQTILVKNHDAIISGNIVYTNSGTWNLASIPSYKLVVQGGNILIDHNVTELSGTFIAEKNTTTGKGGTIFTCATGGTAYDPGGSNFYTDCINPLTIYGSFVAQQVQFLRTTGSVNNASSGDKWNSGGAPAEKFVYGPEMWLANLKVQPSGNDASITGLPPTL